MNTSLRWFDPQNFNEDWKNRIAIMASLLKNERSVLDLGCGMQWLKNFLHSDIHYYPVDYIQRSSDTIICDFNKYEFPNISADTAFISGVLEYIHDYEYFIQHTNLYCTSVIISYNSIDRNGNTSDIKSRRGLGWVNDLSHNDIITLFKELSMDVIATSRYKSNDIFQFTKSEIRRREV